MLEYLLYFCLLIYLGYLGFIMIALYKLTKSRQISGIDKYMLDYVNDSTICSCLELEKEIDMNKYCDQIKDMVKKIYGDNKPELKRYVEINESDKNVAYIRDDNVIDEKTLEKVGDKVIECHDEISIDDENKIYKTPHVDNKYPFKIVLDKKTKRLWIVGNHAYMDGFTMMKLSVEILGIDDKDVYKIKLPLFSYIPLITDYMILRTMYDTYMIKEASLSTLDGKEHTPCCDVQYVTHVKSKVESKNFMSAYVHKMVGIFFEVFPDKTYFNVSILCAIDNSNKINNIGMVLVSIEKTHTVDDIEQLINAKKYQAIGTYFLTNSVKGGKKPVIDIVLSSIPAFKSDKYGLAGGAILPNVSKPIYIFNSKIGDTNTSSIHIRPDFIEHEKVIKVIEKKEGLTVHKINKLF